MIIDKLSNWNMYNFGEVWTKAYEFVNTVTVNTEAKEYEVIKDVLTGIVVETETRLFEDTVLEAHQKMVDVHIVLEGEEIFGYDHISDLEVEQEYDEEKDVVLYDKDGENRALLSLSPGYFVVAFPDDAHMPLLSAEEEPEKIKKLILKIAVDSLD